MRNYVIKTRARCEECGEKGPVALSRVRAEKRIALAKAREKKWFVYGNGEVVICPDCRDD